MVYFLIILKMATTVHEREIRRRNREELVRSDDITRKQQQQNEAKGRKSDEKRTIGCQGSHTLLARGHFLLILVIGFVRG